MGTTRTVVQRGLGQQLAVVWVAIGVGVALMMSDWTRAPIMTLGLFVILAMIALVSARASLLAAAAMFVAFAVLVSGDGAGPSVTFGVIGLVLAYHGLRAPASPVGANLLIGLATCVVVVQLLAPFGIAVALPVVFLSAVGASFVASTRLDRLVFRHLAEVDPVEQPVEARLEPVSGLRAGLAAAGFGYVTTLHHQLMPGTTLTVDVYWDPSRRCWCEVSATGFDLTTAYADRRLITSTRSPKTATALPGHFLLQHADPDLATAVSTHDRTVALLAASGLHAEPGAPRTAVDHVIADTRDGCRYLADRVLFTHLLDRLRHRTPEPHVVALDDVRLAAWARDEVTPS